MYNYIDFNKLFNNESDYGKEMNCGNLDDDLVKEVEEKIGYKIPNSYYQFLKIQNGGLINSNFYDECWLETIFGIGDNSENGLEEMFDNWINDWEYPNIGIPFGMTQSGGHDIYFMDFSVTDSNGEPRVVLIDNGNDNQISFVANNFEEFIKMVYNKEDINGTIID